MTSTKENEAFDDEVFVVANFYAAVALSRSTNDKQPRRVTGRRRTTISHDDPELDQSFGDLLVAALGLAEFPTGPIATVAHIVELGLEDEKFLIKRLISAVWCVLMLVVVDERSRYTSLRREVRVCSWERTSTRLDSDLRRVSCSWLMRR